MCVRVCACACVCVCVFGCVCAFVRVFRRCGVRRIVSLDVRQQDRNDQQSIISWLSIYQVVYFESYRQFVASMAA